MEYFEVKRNPNLIEIPKNATNGDVIKALFPCEEKDEDFGDGTTLYKGLDFSQFFHTDWWKAPYKQEDKE